AGTVGALAVDDLRHGSMARAGGIPGWHRAVNSQLDFASSQAIEKMAAARLWPFRMASSAVTLMPPCSANVTRMPMRWELHLHAPHRQGVPQSKTGPHLAIIAEVYRSFKRPADKAESVSSRSCVW